ncbi:MAG: acetyl-CoA carboxylase biotin carboxyl carrier protein subunit [Bacteroidota bacterium]
MKEGDTIKRDQILLLMEAMKMENQVLAESDGEIKSIKVVEGENVLQGQVLIELA